MRHTDRKIESHISHQDGRTAITIIADADAIRAIMPGIAHLRDDQIAGCVVEIMERMTGMQISIVIEPDPDAE